MSDAAPRSVLSVGAMLGEGPIWVEREAALWFVDIKGHAIHRFRSTVNCHGNDIAKIRARK